jgi:hypothetical protein
MAKRVRERSEGPGVGWGSWRGNRDKKIAKPPKSPYQRLLEKLAKEKEKSQSAKESK